MATKLRINGRNTVRLAIYYALILIVSSIFMRDVYNWGIGLLGSTYLALTLWLSFALVAFFLLKSFRELSATRRALLISVLVFGLVYAAQFEIFEERLHLVKYGLMSWLLCRIPALQSALNLVIFATLGAGLVGAIDELVQSVTPGRVGDLRDVLFDTIGGLWGSMLFVISRYPASIQNSSPVKR